MSDPIDDNGIVSWYAKSLRSQQNWAVGIVLIASVLSVLLAYISYRILDASISQPAQVSFPYFKVGGSSAVLLGSMLLFCKVLPLKEAKKQILTRSERFDKALEEARGRQELHDREVRRVRRKTGAVTNILVQPDETTYSNVFGSFSGQDFFAFFPPFHVEEAQQNNEPMKNILRVHAHRYELLNDARYLVSSATGADKRAVKFFERLEQAYPDISLRTKLEIRSHPNPDPISGTTFFTGRIGPATNVVQRSIVYPVAINPETRLPDVVIILEETEAAAQAAATLRHRFLTEWNAATKIWPANHVAAADPRVIL